MKCDLWIQLQQHTKPINFTVFNAKYWIESTVLMIFVFNVRIRWNHKISHYRKDAKDAIRSRKSKDRQCNGQREKDKHDLQNTTQEIKNWATRKPLKTGGTQELWKGWASSTPLVAHIVLLLIQPVKNDESARLLIK